MGNYRFRLSDMMPNAWLYKLRVMTRGSRNPTLSHTTKKAHPTRTGGSSMSKHFPPPQLPSKESCYQPGRASYYFPSRPEKLPSSPVHPRASDTLFPIEPARKSDKKARRKQERPSAKLVSSSVSSGCSCRATVGSVWKTDTMPEFPPAPENPPYDGGGGDRDENDGLPCSEKPIIAEHYDLDSGAAWSRSCSCRFTSSATDIILDMGGKSSSITRKIEETDDLHSVPEFGLPPILTKPTKREAEPTKADDDASVGSREKHQHKSNPCPPPKKHKGTLRRLSPGIQGLRMPTSSPRLASKKIQAYRQKKAHGSTPRKFLKESFAVIKSSSDPQRDFRDSMVEMIVENNIRASRDLEELLACYLSLNSNEYHDVIVKVFEQIWFDLTNIRS